MSNSEELVRTALDSGLSAHGAREEFCRKTGIPRNNVKNWLAGTRIPLSELDRIAAGLGFSSAAELLKPKLPVAENPQVFLEKLRKFANSLTPGVLGLLDDLAAVEDPQAADDMRGILKEALTARMRARARASKKVERESG